MPNEELMDSIYEQGVRDARRGLDRHANPYFAEECRTTWFQGYDDATSCPHIDRALTPADMIVYGLVFIALICLLYLPIE
jgi:hypothetical protein